MSAVIPTIIVNYNAGDFLRRCVDSLLNCRLEPYSAVGCMNEATTTLTRAGFKPRAFVLGAGDLPSWVGRPKVCFY